MSRVPKRRQWLCYIILLLIFMLTTFGLFCCRKENRDFAEFTTALFQNELTSNALNLHYTLAHPENYGIYHYDTVLPCYHSSDRNQAGAELENYINILSQIDSSQLKESDQYTYMLLSRYLNTSLEGSDFLYYNEPLSPSSGMQSQLPILMAEYSFRSVKDVEDYLSLLGSTGDYFSSLITYEKEKKEAGLFMCYTDAMNVSEQCTVIMSKSELYNGTHFLQTTFSERLEQLKEQKLLTEKQAAHYEAENHRLLTTVVEPAYKALSDAMFELADETITVHGLCSLPEGKKYYEYLLKSNTGSYLSIEEIKGLLYPKFEEEFTLLTELCAKYPEIIAQSTSLTTGTFPYTLPEDMIGDLQLRMQKDFPPFPVTDGSVPFYTIKNISKSLENYCSPAFYLTPPLDDITENVIYINQKNSPEGLSLYTTLAHEGYPGHLYQSVYSQLFMTQNNTNPVRQILWYGGYLEGWALYVEFGSYDYAAQLARENGQEDAAILYTMEKHNRDLQLCLYSILDIAVHYDGADYGQVHKLLSSFGISNPQTTLRIYQYIASEPTTYLKYYLGYLEILNLQTQAQELWKDAYSDYRFHQFFLDCGPSDFITLSEQLDKSPAPKKQ